MISNIQCITLSLSEAGSSQHSRYQGWDCGAILGVGRWRIWPKGLERWAPRYEWGVPVFPERARLNNTGVNLVWISFQNPAKIPMLDIWRWPSNRLQGIIKLNSKYVSTTNNKEIRTTPGHTQHIMETLGRVKGFKTDAPGYGVVER